MDKGLLDNIENKLNLLSKSQKKVALFLLEHYDKAVVLTAAKMAKTVGVSESTVVRFACEMGYDGYPQMQKALLEVVKTMLTAAQRMNVSSGMLDNTEKNRLKFFLRHDADRILTTMAEIEYDVFVKVVDAIIIARKVYIVAGRSASALAIFFHFYLKFMHENVVLIDSVSAGEIYEHMINISDKDICIAISFPRYTRRTVTALEYARSQNAMTIAITDNCLSPIAKLGNLCLCAKTDAISFVDSLAAPMSLIGAILSAISLNKKDSLYDNFEKLEKIWAENHVY